MLVGSRSIGRGIGFGFGPVYGFRVNASTPQPGSSPKPLPILLPLIPLALLFCSSALASSSSPARVSIMTFNAENLFDTHHDQGTDDYPYLPKKDPAKKSGCKRLGLESRQRKCLGQNWTDEKLASKLERVASVLKQVAGGRGADIVVLAEVENRRVLTLLRDGYLKGSGYKTLELIDSFDPRGIDPAVLSRFPLWRKPVIHRIPLKARDKAGEYAAQKTRGILEVPLRLPDGTKAIVFAVHLPSQANPSYLRGQAIAYINRVGSQLPDDVVTITAGDFNITRDEEKSEGYFGKILNQHWQVAHLEPLNSQGTHYFHPKNEWSFLDSILVRRSKQKRAWRLDQTSVRVVNGLAIQNDRHNSPARFAKSDGVSDHWPLYAEIIKP